MSKHLWANSNIFFSPAPLLTGSDFSMNHPHICSRHGIATELKIFKFNKAILHFPSPLKRTINLFKQECLLNVLPCSMTLEIFFFESQLTNYLFYGISVYKNGFFVQFGEESDFDSSLKNYFDPNEFNKIILFIKVVRKLYKNWQNHLYDYLFLFLFSYLNFQTTTKKKLWLNFLEILKFILSFLKSRFFRKLPWF